MKKGLIWGGVIILLIIVVLLGARFFSGEDGWICQNGEWVKHGSPKASKPTTGCSVSSQESVENNELPMEEANIAVFSPKKNESVSSPLDVEGKARVFENVVSLRLKDKNGKILFQGTANAQSPDTGQFGLFQEEIKYSTTQKEGTLEVFQASAKDGSEIDKVVIPVKFENEQSQ